MEDICSSLTSVQARHWASHEIVCTDLIHRKVHATFLGLVVILTSLGLYSCTQVLLSALWLSTFLKKQ